MSHAKITWNPVTGFELDLEHEQDGVKIIMVGMPLPADGTTTLAAGVKLFSLDALFRSEVDVDDAPGQLSDVTVAASGSVLSLTASLENADTMERRQVSLSLPVQIAPGAPEAGGPVNEEPDEDSVIDDDSDVALDGLSALFAAAAPPGGASEPKPAPEATPQGGQGGGLAALLRALAESGDDDEEDAEVEPPAAGDPAVSGLSALAEQTEAKGFLELLVARELLELEDGFGLEVLVEGTAKILAGRGNAETKSTLLSNWLFSQEAVGELYAGDEELETIIDAW